MLRSSNFVVLTWAIFGIAVIYSDHMDLTLIGVMRQRDFWTQAFAVPFWILTSLAVICHVLLFLANTKGLDQGFWISLAGVVVAWVPYPFTGILSAVIEIGAIALTSYLLLRRKPVTDYKRNDVVLALLPLFLYLVSLSAVFFSL